MIPNLLQQLSVTTSWLIHAGDYWDDDYDDDRYGPWKNDDHNNRYGKYWDSDEYDIWRHDSHDYDKDKYDWETRSYHRDRDYSDSWNNDRDYGWDNYGHNGHSRWSKYEDDKYDDRDASNRYRWAARRLLHEHDKVTDKLEGHKDDHDDGNYHNEDARNGGWNRWVTNSWDTDNKDDHGNSWDNYYHRSDGAWSNSHDDEYNGDRDHDNSWETRSAWDNQHDHDGYRWNNEHYDVDKYGKYGWDIPSTHDYDDAGYKHQEDYHYSWSNH